MALDFAWILDLDVVGIDKMAGRLFWKWREGGLAKMAGTLRSMTMRIEDSVSISHASLRLRSFQYYILRCGNSSQ